jgi:hypothetical protein
VKAKGFFKLEGTFIKAADKKPRQQKYIRIKSIYRTVDFNSVVLKSYMSFKDYPFKPSCIRATLQSRFWGRGNGFIFIYILCFQKEQQASYRCQPLEKVNMIWIREEEWRGTCYKASRDWGNKNGAESGDAPVGWADHRAGGQPAPLVTQDGHLGCRYGVLTY